VDLREYDGFYRSKEAKLDAYAQALIDQNSGRTCQHCGASLGHYIACPLLSREVAEAFSAVPAIKAENTIVADLTALEVKFLKECGVTWEGDNRL
jgi:hypothetical protein